VDIGIFADLKKRYLKKFLKGYKKAPSHDTFRRVFGLIDPVKFSEAVSAFLVENLWAMKKILGIEAAGYRPISVDGKEANGTGRKCGGEGGGGIPNLQTLNIYDVTNAVSLLSVPISEKTNEIPVAQKYLAEMQLKGCIVTFGAMNTQKDTVKVITKSGGEYVGGLKGKCEKYHQGVDWFLGEFSLEPIQTLSELNHKFSVWLDEGYIHAPHVALKEEERDPHTGELLRTRERTPYQAYTEDPAKVKYVSSLECRDAFLWEEQRTVDKSGCIKLGGVVFDVGVALIRRRVDVRYDPFDISVIEVWYEGKFLRKAEKLYISEFAPKQETGPVAAPRKATGSRLLKIYEEKNKEREKQRNGALSFSEPNGESNT